MEVAPELLSRFRRRRDKQIMGLELLGVSLGLSTFADLLRGRQVVCHCDNSGAEARARRSQKKTTGSFCISCRSPLGADRRANWTTLNLYINSGSTSRKKA